MFELAEPYIDIHPWVHLTWGALIVVGLAAWSAWRRSKKLGVFGIDRVRSRNWLSSLARRRAARAVLLLCALLLFAVAAIRPRANPQRQRYKITARDLVVLLDVSRSMLADDIQPNRLERAKLEIARLADHLRGDRIGLVAFAGSSVIVCPLTSDYSYFKRVLRDVSVRSAPVGGTRIGDAIWKALGDLLGLAAPSAGGTSDSRAGENVLEAEAGAEKRSYVDLLLITDGEDHDPYSIEAAKSAARLDVGIYAIGLGSEEGAPIRIPAKGGGTEYLRDRQGNVVSSRLDSRLLEDIVNTAARGRYLPAGTFHFDLVDFFEKTIARESGREIVDEQVTWTEIFQPFLLAGLVLYLSFLALPERPRRGQLSLEEAAP